MAVGESRAEQSSGADRLQRPLRSRFRRRLTASVRAFSRAKSCRYRCLSFWSLWGEAHVYLFTSGKGALVPDFRSGPPLSLCRHRAAWLQLLKGAKYM